MPDALRTVGRYEVLRHIGRGGMAVVALARQTDLDRFVALKQLKVLDDDDPSYAQRFLRESRLAGSFNHPSIVTVFDYFEHDGVPYIAMEYVDGGSLRPYVGRLTLPQIAGVLEGVLAGLAHAEQSGVVHRDLKPENLMVTSDGRVKIADFGIAKATTEMHTGAFRTETGTTVGTPTYMAPEQAMAQEVGPWTDLYSVGCIAYELFTGKPPFHDSSQPMAILLRHINEPIPPLTSVLDDFDPRLSAWTAELLVKEPAQRTRSAVDAWDELEEIVLDLLGPRWRREARLSPRPDADPTARPLTPAPFQDAGDERDAEESEAFESFSWGPPESYGAVPGPYTPPPRDLPVEPLRPSDAGQVEDAPPPPVEPVRDERDSTYETFDDRPPPRPPVRSEQFESLIARQAGAVPAEPQADTAEAPPEPAAPEVPADATLAPARRPPPPAEPPSDAPRAPPAEERRPSSHKGARLAAAGLVVCGLLAAVAYGVAPTNVAETELDQEVAGRQMAFRVPAGWTSSPLDAGDDVGRLPLTGEAVSRPAGAEASEAVVAGYSRATDPSLLPDAFVSAITNRSVRPETVRVGAGTAYRYGDLRLRGSDLPMTVIALPTTKGVATLACRGAAGSRVARSCDAIAQTMSVRDGEVLAPPPRRAYAQALNAATGRLASAERRAAARLRGTERPGAIAREAAGLARAYAGAASAIERIGTAPFEAEPTEAIVARLRRLNRSYGDVARAAASRERRRYEAAVRRAGRERAELGAAFRDLSALGYRASRGEAG